MALLSQFIFSNQQNLKPMKQLLLGFLLLFCSCTLNAQSVSIAATEGGSVTFTPEGVVRTAPKTALKGIKASAPKPKTVVQYNDTLKLSTYPVNDLGLEEARMVRNCLASVVYDENPNLTDWKAFNDTRTFILSNKDFKSSNKKLSITVSSEKLDCILSSSGSGYWMGRNEKQVQEEYDRSMRNINMRKKIISQAEDVESKKRVSPDNSVIRRYKNDNN